MLAPRLGRLHPQAVQRAGALRKAALRAGGLDGVAHEMAAERAGEAMDGVTFGRGGGLGLGGASPLCLVVVPAILNLASARSGGKDVRGDQPGRRKAQEGFSRPPGTILNWSLRWSA